MALWALSCTHVANTSPTLDVLQLLCEKIKHLICF